VDARRLIWVAVVALALAGCDGCKSQGDEPSPPLASADPTGAQFVPGTIVGATEPDGGVRIYKLIEVNWFPAPVGDELVFIAYEPKATSFEQARLLWRQRGLKVALVPVRVQRHLFVKRDHRILGNEPVTDADKQVKTGDPQSKPSG
jgi:hypothetical protein